MQVKYEQPDNKSSKTMMHEKRMHKKRIKKNINDLDIVCAKFKNDMEWYNNMSENSKSPIFIIDDWWLN